MTCFADASAFYAILDAGDSNNAPAHAQWEELLHGNVVMLTTVYVLTESYALVQHRLGLAAVRAFREDVYPLLYVDWCDKALHETGTAALLSAQRRPLSLVDCISFEIMRRHGAHHAFAFDAHFSEHGFLLVPSARRPEG